jgi:hypothetical protein
VRAAKQLMKGKFKGRDPMKRITVVLVCALIAPLAFAQTKSTKGQKPTQTKPATTQTATTHTMGLVTTYQPGKTIVINSTQGPVSFALSTSAQVVNAAGNAVTAPLNPGQRVDVYYTGTGESRMAERVVVQD